MGKVKDKLKKQSEGQSFTLSNSEFNFARDLNASLKFHILRQRLVAGYLTILTKHHLPEYEIPQGMALEFQLDLTEDSDQTLTLNEVSVREE